MATQQYFALDSLATGYAAAIAKLATDTSTNRGYTVTQVVRAASHDSDIKIICAYVDESDLTGDAAGLAATSYPNELCRHHWESLNEFRRSGFHRLGESVRSFERVAGRTGIHVGRVGSGAADGSTCHDRIAFASVASFAAGSSYFFHDLFWQARTGMSNSVANVDCETGGAATAAGSINFYCDQKRTPGLFLNGQETYTGTRFDDDLAWTSVATLVGANCWIKGNMFDPSQSNVLIGGSTMYDTGQADPANNGTDITNNAQLDRKSSLAEVVSSETSYYRPLGADKFASPYGAPDAVIQDDGGSFTDLTAAAASAGGADIPMFPASPATGDALYVGHDELWNVSMFGISTAGVGTYVLAKEYWNGASWAAIPTSTWLGNGTSSVDWKGGTGNGGVNYTDPGFVFNPPDAWAKTTVNGQGPFYYIRFRHASGTMTTPPVADDGLVGACFAVVHLKDDADPNDAPIIPEGAGMQITYRLSSRVGQVQFLNFNALRPGNFVQMSGSGVLPTVLRVLGGRWMEGTTMYQNGELDEWNFGAEEDRDPPWDTSDRPNHADHAGIQRIVTKWDTDPTEFTAAKVAKWLHLCRWTVGPHPSNTVTSGDAPGPPLWWPMDGVLMDDVGTDHKGITRSTDPDKHSWAIRGGFAPTTPSIHRRVISRRGHAHFYAYATSDTNEQSPIGGNCRTIGPLTIQDSVIDGVGPNLDNAAGIFALRFGGDSGNGQLRDNGQGVRNITLQRVALMNILTPLDADGSVAMAWNWDQSPTIDGVSVIGCTKGIGAGGATAASVLYVVTEDNGTGFTDQTADNYNSVTYDAFPATPAVNDAIYFGYKRWPFKLCTPNIVTSGVGSGLTGVWEYATAEDTWATISQASGWSDAVSDFTAATGDRALAFNKPADWVITDKGGSLTYEVYWIRFRITAGTYSVVPQITSVNGPTGGGMLISTEADKIEFIDMEGPWLGIEGLNTNYEFDGRTLIVDRVTGRLKSGETIATFEMFWKAAAGTDTRYTLAQIKGGSLDKAFASTSVHQDNVGVLMANVSETPDVDIEEVP